MEVKSLPAGQVQDNRADVLADLNQMLFRLEARATLAADIGAVAAAESLDRNQRHALAVELAEAVTACRALADALDA